MAPFKTKHLPPPKRICLRLKEARENAHVSLDELARRTKISRHYLAALEECRFDDLPPALLYQKKFIKAYVEALHLPSEPFLHQFLDEESTPSGQGRVHPKKNIGARHLHNVPLALGYLVIGALVLVFLGYLGLQVRSILTPPRLTVYS